MYLVCSKALDTVAVLTSNIGHDGLDGQIIRMGKYWLGDGT